MTVSQISAVLQRVFREERIPVESAAELEGFYRRIADDVVTARAKQPGGSLILGICGSQGSGKSTLARALQEVLREMHGLSVAVLSLDDLYLSALERDRLASEVHPLLQTRGVPGTHDVDLGIGVIRRLVAADPGDTTAIPRFDKALDEPRAAGHWEQFRGRADIVIFEGWCVGAVPQLPSTLRVPTNDLERDADRSGTWRFYVNAQLAGRYQGLFGLIDRLLMLRAPSFEVVFEWRREQEGKLPARTMNDEQLRRFIMHYERLTRHILSEMPARADVVVDLDARRRMTISAG